jgi:hypothetical protein
LEKIDTQKEAFLYCSFSLISAVILKRKPQIFLTAEKKWRYFRSPISEEPGAFQKKDSKRNKHRPPKRSQIKKNYRCKSRSGLVEKTGIQIDDLIKYQAFFKL